MNHIFLSDIIICIAVAMVDPKSSNQTNHMISSNIIIYNVVAMVALASAAPQFHGDSSNAIILQEQRWAGLCFGLFLYYCIIYIIYVFLFICVLLYYIYHKCFSVYSSFFLTGLPPPSKTLAEDKRFKVIFLLVLNGARTS